MTKHFHDDVPRFNRSVWNDIDELSVIDFEQKYEVELYDDGAVYDVVESIMYPTVNDWAVEFERREQDSVKFIKRKPKPRIEE